MKNNSYYFIESVTNQNIDYQWNHFLTIYWQIAGNATITSTYLEENILLDQLYFIPYNEMYRINSLEGQAILFKFNINSLSKIFDLQIPLIYFDPLKMLAEEVKTLKVLLADFLQVYASNIKDKETALLSILFKIIHELNLHFSVNDQVTNVVDEASEWIQKIKNYLFETANQNEEIKTIAQTFFMTPSYFSKFFKEKTGLSPSSYRRRIRLENARSLLESTNEKIESIAEKTGFQDSQAFIRSFKKDYQTTPKVYRDNFRNKNSQALDYHPLSQSSSEIRNVLEHYLNKSSSNIQSNESIFRDEIKLDLHHCDQRLPKSLNKILFVSSISILNRSDTRQMLKLTQQEIGFEYISFHGLFDDSLPIYMEEIGSKNPYLFYDYLDELLDFLLSINLKPMLEFSYLPRHLRAASDSVTSPQNSNLQLPKSMEQWDFLVESMVRHFSERYGRKNVSQWLFCSWPFPDLNVDVLKTISDQAFYDLYYHTFTAVKSVDLDFQFGIPNMIYSEIETGTWFNRFLEFTREKNCLPDFYGYYFLATDREYLKRYLRQQKIPMLSADPQALNKSIHKVLKNTEESDLVNADLYLPVIDFCYAINPLEDTIFKSCYLVKNALENMSLVKGLGCTQLTDMSLNVTMKNTSFQGLSGLFTSNGIPKASFYACQFLSQLQGDIIGQGQGWIAVKSDDMLRILLYHYQHFTSEYAQLEITGVDQKDRYLPFDMKTSKRIVISLNNIEHPAYLRKDIFINQKNGSSFDQWSNLGKINNFDYELKDYLRKKSVPGLSYKYYETRDHSLTLQVKLEPLEVRLIELKECLPEKVSSNH